MDECAFVEFQIMNLGRNSVSREDAFYVGERDFHVFRIVGVENVSIIIHAYNIVIVVNILAGARAFSRRHVGITTATAASAGGFIDI